MDFKCNCNMTDKLDGDGCQKCNTELAINCLSTPVELANDLKHTSFTDDQANDIAAEVYQPLLSLISTLNEKINELAKAV